MEEVVDASFAVLLKNGNSTKLLTKRSPYRRQKISRAKKNEKKRARREEGKRKLLPGRKGSICCTLPRGEKGSCLSLPKTNFDLSLIGAAAARLLMSKGCEVSVVSMTDIMTQREKDTIEPDPATLLPPELQDFVKVFSKEDSNMLSPNRGEADHHIILEDGKKPDWVPRIYRMSQEEHEEARRWVTENLSKGFIEASKAPWASPIMFVKKPGGGVRLCVDYRKLNAISKRDRYPLPLIDDIVTLLSGSKILTRLDIR